MSNLWDQQNGESPEAYNAFRKGYLEQGPERTIATAIAITGRESKLIYRLSELFHWIKRARAYDRWLIAVQEKAVQKTLEKDATVWAHRRSQFRELEFTLAGELIEKARAILALPITEQVVESDTLEPTEDGMIRKTIIVVKPVRATPSDAAKLIDTADKLARLSVQLETERRLIGLDISPDVAQRVATARRLYEVLLDRYAARPDVIANIPSILAEQWGIEPHQLLDSNQNDGEPGLASESEQ